MTSATQIMIPYHKFYDPYDTLPQTPPSDIIIVIRMLNTGSRNYVLSLLWTRITPVDRRNDTYHL